MTAVGEKRDDCPCQDGHDWSMTHWPELPEHERKRIRKLLQPVVALARKGRSR